MRAKLKAFTIIELIVALVILAFLISLAAPLVGNVQILSAKKQAAVCGEEFYMAAAAAVDTVCAMHMTEFTDSLDNQDRMIVTSSDFFAVQCGSLKNFDYVKGFRDFSENSKKTGKALVIKHTLEGLNALNRDIGLTEERLRFASAATPSGTVQDYEKQVKNSSYNIDGSDYSCSQAGVIICCAKAKNGSGGEIVYTEYGDENGHLVICINPAWYEVVEEQLQAVKQNPLTNAEKEKACHEKDSASPIVITVLNGTYEVH